MSEKVCEMLTVDDSWSDPSFSHKGCGREMVHSEAWEVLSAVHTPSDMHIPPRSNNRKKPHRPSHHVPTRSSY